MSKKLASISASLIIPVTIVHMMFAGELIPLQVFLILLAILIGTMIVLWSICSKDEYAPFQKKGNELLNHIWGSLTFVQLSMTIICFVMYLTKEQENLLVMWVPTLYSVGMFLFAYFNFCIATDKKGLINSISYHIRKFFILHFIN